MASSKPGKKSNEHRSLQFLKKDWYFLLLPVFFVAHGLAENVGLIPISELLILLLVLLVISLAFFAIFRIYFKSAKKSALFTFIFLLLFLFFGVCQDFAEKLFGINFFSSLTFLSILSVLIFIGSFFRIRKSGDDFGRLPIFMNFLFLIYLLIDVAGIINKTTRFKAIERSSVEHSLKLRVCDSCAKPSVFLVLLDEYAGTPSLKNYFNYDNSSFEDSLGKLGFRVAKQSHSNYYYTVYSMASMLNLEYIAGFKKHGVKDEEGYRLALEMIKDNLATEHFKEDGYAIKNYSYFDFNGYPAEYKNDYLPGKINLIIHKTMYARVVGRILNLLGTGTPIIFSAGDWEDEYVKNNEDMMRRALELPNENLPVFSYIHLMMPHEPFAFNSKGERTRKSLRATSKNIDEVDEAYLQYLIYTNQRIFQFITELKSRTQGKAVILLMSDHAYRGYERKGKNELLYSNLNAVYLPGQGYAGWKDGMTNVNQFRLLFSSLFQQEIPLLEDVLVK